MDIRSIAVSCLILLGAAAAAPPGHAACSASANDWASSPDATTRPQVLVLGVYHMANPNKDVADARAGDVLGPKRQAQIERLVEVLKRFEPTKIAVERLPNDAELASNYSDYLAGEHDLGRNEIQQIGFRLAKELGLDAVCGADADVMLHTKRVKKYAREAGRLHEYNALIKGLKKQANALTAYLHTHTVLQTLIRLNSDAWIAKDKALYYRMAHFSRPGDWAGADMLSIWFKRNMRIYANTVNLIDSSHARILVIFGAGHLGWLRHDFASDLTIRLRKLAEFVKQMPSDN